jgi:hypothetical protein
MKFGSGRNDHAYALALFGIRAANRHDVTEYRNSMMVACDQVGG